QNDMVSIVLTFPPIYFDALIFLFCITIGQLAADQHHRQREHLAFLVLKAKRLQQSICLFLSHSLTALQSFYRRMYQDVEDQVLLTPLFQLHPERILAFVSLNRQTLNLLLTVPASLPL